MKTFFAPLSVVLALAVASTASAGVFVHAGPVTVAVGGRPHSFHPQPVVAHPLPLPVFVPGPGWVAPPLAAGSPGRITRSEAREIRDEAQDLRREIRQAGSHISPREAREIRDEAQDVRREIRQALRH